MKLINKEIENPNTSEKDFLKFSFNVNNGLNIYNFRQNQFRFGCYIASIAVIFATFFIWDIDEFFENTKDRWNWTFHFEERAKIEYNNDVTARLFIEDFDHYLAKKKYMKRQLLIPIITVIFWYWPLAYILLSRNRPPIRFDKKNRIIYTWSRNKLYFQKLNNEQPELYVYDHHFSKDDVFQPTIIFLHNKKGKKKKFFLGIYPDLITKQWFYLSQFIWAYLSKKNVPTNDQWLKDIENSKEYNFVKYFYMICGFSLRKTLSLDSEKVQKELASVLQSHSVVMPDDTLFDNDAGIY
jgi:hypothetical protein